MIFGTLTPEKNWHKNLTDLSTSSVRRIYFTWEIQKSFSTVLFIHTSDYLHYLRRKQTVIHLPTPPENVITLTCEMQNFFIWLKVCYVLSNGGGSEESQLWVVTGGSKKNHLFLHNKLSAHHTDNATHNISSHRPHSVLCAGDEVKKTYTDMKWSDLNI